MRLVHGLLLFTLIFPTGCDKNKVSPQEESEKPLVTNVYDYNNNLVAHYKYNENNKLIKREFTDPVSNVSSDLIFYYKDNLVSRIDYVDHNFQSSHEKYYYYNDDKKIIKIETYQREKLLSTFYINYTSTGLVESFYTSGNEPRTFYNYDIKRNIIKTTNYLTDPWNGQESTQECRFVYDSRKKANFGLDYLIGIELLPWRGTTSNWEQSLSQNNLLNETCSGNEYTIEYNQNDYPTAITTKWKNIETETPMTIRIEYNNNP